MTRVASSALLASLLLLVGCGGATPEPAAPDAAEAAHDPSHHAAEAVVADAGHAAETTQPASDGWITYGAALSDAAAVASSAVISAPADYVGKVVKVEGSVAQVCQSAGCWLSFTHEGKELTVNMKDHAFSVDKKGAGSWCEAEGELALNGESLSMAAHAVRMKPAPGASPAGEAAPAPAGETPPGEQAAPASQG